LRIEPASGVLHLERALIRVESGSPDVEAIREDARRARDAGLALPPELRRFAR
jgi:hypothetical protein